MRKNIQWERTKYYQMNVNIGLKSEILRQVVPSIGFQLPSNHMRFGRRKWICVWVQMEWGSRERMNRNERTTFVCLDMDYQHEWERHKEFVTFICNIVSVHWGHFLPLNFTHVMIIVVEFISIGLSMKLQTRAVTSSWVADILLVFISSKYICSWNFSRTENILRVKMKTR